MYQNCCKKCGSISLHTEVKGNNTGLYCDDCGSWITWLGKNELRAFEYSRKDKEKSGTGLCGNDILNKENIDYSIKFIKQRIKLADSEERKLMHGERQALNIALIALEKVNISRENGNYN